MPQQSKENTSKQDTRKLCSDRVGAHTSGVHLDIKVSILDIEVQNVVRPHKQGRACTELSSPGKSMSMN